MPPAVSWLRLGRTSERFMFALAGILFCAGILGATLVLLERDKAAALAEEAERGKLITGALAANIARTMGALESTLDALEHQLEGIGPDQREEEERMASLAYRSTLLRSLSVVSPDGTVLASTAAGHRRLRLNLASLGFTREILTSLEPGMLQFVRDIGDQETAVSMDAALPVTSIPFARTAVIHGRKVILLAMVNPASLFLDARSAGEDASRFAAVFDYQGRVLAATRHSDFLPGRAYHHLPLPGSGEDTAEYGRFRTVGPLAGESGNAYIVNYRGAGLYPLIAVTGRSESHALEAWRKSAQNVQWLGLAAAVLVFLYTAMLWRVMGNRQKIEVELVRAKEAAEQANAARGVFLSTVSHEIRTPMNAVLGMAELLRDTRLDAEQDDYVRTLQDSARSLLAIIDDVLDFSKIDAGKMSIELVPLQLEQLARASVALLSVHAREKGLAMNCEIAAGIPHRVLGDPNRLRQILLNLLGNAIKFTEAGEVRLRIFPAVPSYSQPVIRFEVSDTGIGIDSDTAERLFTPFTQADGSVTRRYGGTGLGLSICKRLVELMGGSIGLDSNPGKGSVFWFELPMRALADAEPARPLPQAGSATRASRTEAPAAPGRDCRILVVDDNPMNQKVALRQLAKLGYAAQVASNGEEALTLLSAASFDLVLMDCQMPVMDGFEATRRIRRSESEDGSGRRIQIVAMTANAMEGDRQRCLDAGMDDYLAKPIAGEQLAALLSRRLDGAGKVSAAHAETPAEAPELLSARQLRATFGDDFAFQKEMLALFLTTSRQVLDRLGAAAAAGDLETAQALGHRLFGSCGTLGADQLAALGRQAEQAARAGDAGALRAIHLRMLDVYRELEQAIPRLEAAAASGEDCPA